MNKLEQLERIRGLGLPTPRFVGVTWDHFQQEGLPKATALRFPLAVRSTFSEEDSTTQSFAGHFTTRLDVLEADLEEAVEAVFASYPDPAGQQVILQEMLEPVASGVLFAFRKGVWKLETAPTSGEAVVGGKVEVETLLLPRFSRADAFFSRFYRFWKSPLQQERLRRPLIQLSWMAGHLLQHMQHATHGLDIEFAITDKGLFLLQARPITTPDEAEEVLTTANHKEILPPYPSHLMTSVIVDSGPYLFDFYRSLDKTLPERNFLEGAEGMPWINLSALLDLMVHWGIPTRLVGHSIGAADVYSAGFRPWRFVRKIPVFLRFLRRQWSVRKDVKDWVWKKRVQLKLRSVERELLWESDPANAVRDWLEDFKQLYRELVTHMQVLTAAMSGPVGLAASLGILDKITSAQRKKSAGTDYLEAFRGLQNGLIDRDQFLRRFGHRGFYESDIGQKRFWEYTDEDWLQLLGHPAGFAPNKAIDAGGVANNSRRIFFLFRPVVRLIHTREWIRHISMLFFWQFREEMLVQTRSGFGEDFAFWEYDQEELVSLFGPGIDLEQMHSGTKIRQSGWDMDTFLCNRQGRRLPLSVLSGMEAAPEEKSGIGIYPGVIRGQVWKVGQADFGELQIPPYPSVILLAEALDPGWIPFFSRVDGVLSYVGGLLSHASIILREAQIPSITQVPRYLDLQDGDWIEMNGKTGAVKKLEQKKLWTEN